MRAVSIKQVGKNVEMNWNVASFFLLIQIERIATWQQFSEGPQEFFATSHKVGTIRRVKMNMATSYIVL